MSGLTDIKNGVEITAPNALNLSRMELLQTPKAQLQTLSTVQIPTEEVPNVLGDLPHQQLTTINDMPETTPLNISSQSELNSEFYKTYSQHGVKGQVALPLRNLELLSSPISLQGRFTLDPTQRGYLASLRALNELRDGWSLIPRRRAVASHTTVTSSSKQKTMMYCLSYALTTRRNGYVTRSHGVIRGLQQAGWTVHVAQLPTPLPSGSPLNATVSAETVVDGVVYPGTLYGGWDPSSLAPPDVIMGAASDHYMREAMRVGADVVVAASNHMNALPALVAARRLGLPFVYEVRGLWEVTRASKQPLWAGSEHFDILSGLEAQAAREADLVATLTTELADELVRRGVDRSHIMLVPNAADPSSFNATTQARDEDLVKQLKLPQGVAVVGFAGSVVMYEGLALLMDALGELKARSTVDFVFLLVGAGDSMADIQARAAELGIDDKCRVTGSVPFNDVHRYITLMDIMPIPRLSLPVTEMVAALKPLEAMAMSKALVLSDVAPHLTVAGAGPELRARLFAKDNATALADAIQALIRDPGERERLGRAGRKWVESERNWKAVTQVYSQAILDVMGGN